MSLDYLHPYLYILMHQDFRRNSKQNLFVVWNDYINNCNDCLVNSKYGLFVSFDQFFLVLAWKWLMIFVCLRVLCALLIFREAEHDSYIAHVQLNAATNTLSISDTLNFHKKKDHVSRIDQTVALLFFYFFCVFCIFYVFRFTIF